MLLQICNFVFFLFLDFPLLIFHLSFMGLVDADAEEVNNSMIF